MTLTQGYKQLGLQLGDNQTYFRLVRNSSASLVQGKIMLRFSRKQFRSQTFALQRPSRMRSNNKERGILLPELLQVFAQNLPTPTFSRS